METYEVELERIEADRFLATVPALPGLLLLGASVDEVLERALEAIEFRAQDSSVGSSRVRIAVVSRLRLAS